MFQPLPLFIGLRYCWAREHSFFVSFITWVSLLGVALGVATLIIILSVMNGFESELRARLLSLSAHATVQLSGEQARDWRGSLERLRGAPHLTGAAPYLDIDAMLSHPPMMSGAIVRGIDPQSEQRLSDLAGSLREGRLSDLQPGSNRIVLGRMLAYELEVGVGDSVTVMIPGRGANGVDIVPRLQEFQVVGIFEVGLQEHDSVLALVSLADAEGLKGADAPAGIRLTFDDVLQAPALARQAAARLAGGAQVRDWTQENAATFRAIRIEKGMMSTLLMLIVAVAGFNIVATLVMVVTDKRTDIAILRTLGLDPGGVLAIFITQGVLIGWIGTALGVILGVSVALNVDVIVPAIESTFGFHIMDPDVYSIASIPSELHPADVVIIALCALLLTFVATLQPSWRASRTAPADALRYE
ncbi:MAG: lipoprotein-releasing ABC transporter permease subunit [Steroidobacteraceae bacterium]